MTKKVCLVIPSLKAGGMERVMSELSNFFSTQNNIQVHLVLLSNDAKFYKISKNVKIYEPKFKFNNNYRIFYTLKTIAYLRHTIKMVNPVTILSFGEMYNSFVLLSTLFLNIQTYVSDRSKPDKRWGKTHESLRKLLYPKAAGIISQTQYSKRFISQETGHHNIRVIPNPIKPFLKDETIKENIILNVGRLILSKRVDLLIQLFSEINKVNSSWKLWLVGDGPEKCKLKQLVEDLKLDSHIKLWGNQKEINKFYSQAKIFAFTSESEGFPNAILESMSAGLPVIAFDCIAGPSDLIRNDVNGYLIPLGASELYKQKLLKLMNNTDIRVTFGANATRISRKYDITIIGNEYLNFILS